MIFRSLRGFFIEPYKYQRHQWDNNAWLGKTIMYSAAALIPLQAKLEHAWTTCLYFKFMGSGLSHDCKFKGF
jgi:hypothetical protein